MVCGEEVGRDGIAHQEPVQPEDQVDDAPVDEEVPCLRVRARHQDAGSPKEQVDRVVEDGHLEDPEQQRFRGVAGQAERVLIGGEAGNESQDAGQAENGARSEGSILQACSGAFHADAGCHVLFSSNAGDNIVSMITNKC